jgi:hypothetical protein
VTRGGRWRRQATPPLLAPLSGQGCEFVFYKSSFCKKKIGSLWGDEGCWWEFRPSCGCWGMMSSCARHSTMPRDVYRSAQPWPVVRGCTAAPFVLPDPCAHSHGHTRVSVTDHTPVHPSPLTPQLSLQHSRVGSHVLGTWKRVRCYSVVPHGSSCGFTLTIYTGPAPVSSVSQARMLDVLSGACSATALCFQLSHLHVSDALACCRGSASAAASAVMQHSCHHVMSAHVRGRWLR